MDNGNKLDFVILTETWLDNTANTELAETSPSNYSNYDLVAVIYKNIFSCKSLSVI